MAQSNIVRSSSSERWRGRGGACGRRCRRSRCPRGWAELGGEGEADAEAAGWEAHGALEPSAPLVVADGVAAVDPGPLAGVERELGLVVLQQQPSLLERVAVELGFCCHRFVTAPRLEVELLEGQWVLPVVLLGALWLAGVAVHRHLHEVPRDGGVGGVVEAAAHLEVIAAAS